MDVYIHTEIIEQMNPDEKYQLLREAEFLADNCEARITISKEGRFKYLFNVLTGRDLAYRREIELDSNQINKIILQILHILCDDILYIKNEQLSLEERVENLERNVFLVMAIQRKMLDKLYDNDNDKTDMLQYSEMLNQSLLDEKKRQEDKISQAQNQNNKIYTIRKIEPIIIYGPPVITLPSFKDNIVRQMLNKKINSILKKCLNVSHDGYIYYIDNTICPSDGATVHRLCVISANFKKEAILYEGIFIPEDFTIDSNKLFFGYEKSNNGENIRLYIELPVVFYIN